MTRDDFLPYVMPDLPGCPIPMVMSKAVEVLTDFCTRGNSWVETLDPVYLSKGIATYDLDAPAGARIHSIQSATFNGRPVTPRTRQEMHATGSAWELHEGQPQHVILQPTGVLQVYPKPNLPGMRLSIDARLIPTPQLAELPDAVMNLDAGAIAHGVKGRLMMMKNKSWSAPEMVPYHLGEYERLLSEARVRSYFGGGDRTLTVPPQPFGGVYLGG